MRAGEVVNHPDRAGVTGTIIAHDTLPDAERVWVQWEDGSESWVADRPDWSDITIRLKLWDDRADWVADRKNDDDIGLTEDAYTELMGALAEFGYDIEIERSKS